MELIDRCNILQIVIHRITSIGTSINQKNYGSVSRLWDICLYICCHPIGLKGDKKGDELYKQGGELQE